MSSSFKPDTAQAWLVLKFGGTSVSSAVNWRNIAQVLRARIAEHFRPVVVHSALSGVTDRLESLLTAALTAVHTPVLDHIEAAHRDLAGHLGIVPNPQFEAFMRELRTRFTGEVVALSEYLGRDLVALWGYDDID